MDVDERASLGWQVFEETNDAVFMMTDDNVICEVNPFAQRLTGYARSELVGRPLLRLFTSSSAEIQDAMEALSHTGIFHSREQFELHSNLAGLLPVNISISRIHTQHGTFGVVIARDISERVASERQLREARDQLERRVAERTSELAEANRQLAAATKQLHAAQETAIKQEQLRIAGQIASGMAHDINNSVTPILNFAEVLAADVTLSQGQREQVQHIKIGATDIAATVRRLQELKPLRSQLSRRAIPLIELLQSVADLTRPQWNDDAKRKGVSIDLQVSEAVPATVLGDESALRSVFANLVFNAIDAIRDHGLIELKCVHHHDCAIVEVSDNGEGMTEAQLSECFDPFVTTRDHGCGLGLSLSQKIVERHGGRLEIASDLGQGTIVRVSLPLATAEHIEVPQQRKPPANTRILLVDDDELVRTSSQILLQLKGITIDVAASAQEALSLLAESDYDVVISDLVLPEMDGMQLLRECRNQQPQLRTILLTGWIGGGDSSKGSADVVLEKPLQVDDLLDTLAALENDSA